MIQPHKWAKYENPMSIFNGLSCYVAEVTGGISQVEFSDDGPRRPVLTSHLIPMRSKEATE